MHLIFQYSYREHYLKTKRLMIIKNKTYNDNKKKYYHCTSHIAVFISSVLSKRIHIAYLILQCLYRKYCLRGYILQNFYRIRLSLKDLNTDYHFTHNAVSKIKPKMFTK